MTETYHLEVDTLWGWHNYIDIPLIIPAVAAVAAVGGNSTADKCRAICLCQCRVHDASTATVSPPTYLPTYLTERRWSSLSLWSWWIGSHTGRENTPIGTDHFSCVTHLYVIVMSVSLLVKLWSRCQSSNPYAGVVYKKCFNFMLLILYYDKIRTL